MYTELGAHMAHAAPLRERGYALPGAERVVGSIASRPRVSARDARSMQATLHRWVRDTATRTSTIDR